MNRSSDSGLKGLLRSVFRDKEYLNRYQAVALILGVLVVLLSVSLLFLYQLVNFRTTTKIQNAFIEQYSGLIVSRLSDFESKVSGLQTLLTVLNENNSQVNGFNIHVKSTTLWADLQSLLHSRDSLFAASNITLDEKNVALAKLTSLSPALSVIKPVDALEPGADIKLQLSVPMLQGPVLTAPATATPPNLSGMLHMELDIAQLRRILQLLEDTTKFSAGLYFSNSSGQSFSLSSQLFHSNQSTFFSPVYPRVTRELEALGGQWTLELKPTLTTLEVAGLSTQAMIMKLLGCLALGLFAWVMSSYSFHLFFTRQRLQLLKKLEKANAELTEKARLLDASKKNAEDFIGILGHEIRNPLATMKCVYAELEHLELNQDAQRLIEIQGSALTTALDTLNNILDLKKMELSALQLESIEFEPLLIVNQVRDFVSVQCRSKRVRLRTDLDRTIPLRIMGDPLRMKQVLMNLMNNAVKFTRAGSQVDLIVEVSSISSSRVTLAFVVSDCGDGIEPDMIKKLLEPYQQADSSIARQYGGTGLGLNIASRIIQMMGGELQIESRIGVGTQCKFELTFNYSGDKKINLLRHAEFDSAEWFQAQQQKLDLREGKQTLLYVDDNNFNLMIAEELLKKSSHRLVTFSNPKEALRFLETTTEKIDIVVTDLNMPEMSGVEFARSVRQGRHSNTVFIAVMTASSLEETQLLNAEDFDSILLKPFSLDRILASFDTFRSKTKALPL